LAEIFKEKASGNILKANEVWNEFKGYLYTIEDELQPVLEIPMLIRVIDDRIGN
jgi:hypothetical protein